MVATQGKVGDGVQLDPFQTIFEVHWGVNCDIILMYDTTGSNWSVANNRYFNDVSATLNFTSGIRVGLASQGDYPILPYGNEGDVVFALNANFISKDQFNFGYSPGLTAVSGGDGPEAQLDAIVQCAFAGWTWRENSTRIMILITDQIPHEATEVHTTNAAATAACASKKIFPVICSPDLWGLGFGLRYSNFSTVLLDDIIKDARAYQW